MDWAVAIDKNRVALLQIVAGITALFQAHTLFLSRRTYLTALSILRPVESALRRLIVIAARGMTPPNAHTRKALAGPIPSGKADYTPCFRLFDARLRLMPKRLDGVTAVEPHFGVVGIDDPVFEGARSLSEADLVDCRPIKRRLDALQTALSDLPKQARRLVRMLARGQCRYTKPMRTGRPPGHRAKGRDAADEVLSECHALALYALRPPDI